MINRRNRRVRRVAIAAVAALSLAACSSDQNGQGSSNGPANGNTNGTSNGNGTGVGNGSGSTIGTGAGNGPGSGSAPATNGTGAGNGPGPVQVGSDGVTNIDDSTLHTQLDALPIATLTSDEQAGLLRMREEEKLAHDVYVAMNRQWQLKVFANIATAEQTHSDAVQVLIDRYSLGDPTAGNAPGVFTDPELQSLYTALVGQGSASLAAALTVGATVEDLDIADLRSRATTTPDIALVYANLEKASRNHLRAFAKELAEIGATYTPTHISQADYDAIISGDIETGVAG